MYRLCFRYLNDSMDAEEVLVNGFVKVFGNLVRLDYRDTKSFEAWVKRIMVNEALMYLRKRNSFVHVSVEDAPPIESHDHTDSHLSAEDIYAMVLRLPPGYRTVFNLYAIEGYAHKEIAETLGISENTSKSQLSKARAMLKKMLTKTEASHESRRH